MLFGAIPCTGGSPYQFLNWYLGPKTRNKIREHRRIFRVLWRNFVTVADRCRANGGRIAIEWPRAYLYWRDRHVKAAVSRWGLQSFNFDGCMYGLKSQAAPTRGKFLRKPWRIASDCERFWGIVECCDNRHEHVKTAGSDTKRTESYTDAMVDRIHLCWGCSCT